MKNRRTSRLLALSACLLVSIWARPSGAQIDPLELQKQAIARIDRFVDQFRRTGDFRSQIAELSRADAELTASNRALTLREDWAALALGLTKQGHIYRMQAQWQQAVGYYQMAEEAARRAKHVVYQADAVAWRALALSSQGNVGQAFVDATQAVRLAEGTTDADVLARALDVLGTVQISQMDLAGAADTSNREVEVARQATDPTAPYYAYLNRSDVYLKTAGRCDFQRSFEPCYQALDRARADLEQARAIVSRLGFPGMVQQTDEFLRNVETRRELVRSQERVFGSVQQTSVFHPTRANDVLVTQRFVPEPSEIPVEFEQIYQVSKQFEQQYGGFAELVEARTAYVDGLVNEMRGENDAALASYMKAIERLERDRRSLHDERSRGTFAEDRINFYYYAALQLLERGRNAEAFEVLERSRSRALADLLASRTPGFQRPEEQKLYTEAAVLRTNIADTQGELFELMSQPNAARNSARVTTLQNRIRTLEGQYEEAIERMATATPRLQNLVVSSPATLAALQQSMRTERYELLQYLVLEHAVIVWHIGPDSVTVRNVFLPRTEVIGKVATLQKSLSDRNTKFDETTAREMFLYLIQPVLSSIRSDRLVIIPHEDLSYVPFQVFLDPANGRYLGERFQITYAPSASVLLGLKRSQGISGGRLLAVADPGIAAAAGEVGGIAKLFPGASRVMSTTLASEGDVKAAIRDYDVIHLSVHGRFNAAEPMLSYLGLAPGGTDDGRLTAAEMFGLPLDNSRLVVLSACETGRAQATHGNEILGMVRALMYAGAGTLVLSYWEVDSDATALWMQTFYQTVLTRPVAEAARAALAKVKGTPQYSHPYYWAAFAMIGR